MADNMKELINVVTDLKVTMEKKFANIEEKLEEHDKQFTAINKKLKEHDKQFIEINKKLEEHDDRFDILEAGIKEINHNQVKIFNSIKVMEHDIDNNKKHIQKMEEREQYL